VNEHRNPLSITEEMPRSSAQPPLFQEHTIELVQTVRRPDGDAAFLVRFHPGGQAGVLRLASMDNRAASRC
jgi:hypothetical protein